MLQQGSFLHTKRSEIRCTFEMVMLSSGTILQVDRGTEALAEFHNLKHQQRIHVVGINPWIHPLSYWLAESRHLWSMIQLSLKQTLQVCQFYRTLNTLIPLHHLQQELVVTVPHQTSITNIHLWAWWLLPEVLIKCCGHPAHKETRAQYCSQAVLSTHICRMIFL